MPSYSRQRNGCGDYNNGYTYLFMNLAMHKLIRAILYLPDSNYSIPECPIKLNSANSAGTPSTMNGSHSARSSMLAITYGSSLSAALRYL